jgi:trans-aconitate methyltransferase
MDYQEEYLKLNKDLHDSDFYKKSQAVLHILPSDFRPDSVIDIACGSGKITMEVSKKLGIRKTTGIDISHKIIEIAKQNDVDRIGNWVTINIFDYKESGYDLVLAIDIVEHVEEDKEILNKIASLGSLAVIKVPIEDNSVNRFIMWITRKKINPWKETEAHYGHVHHYSLNSFIELIEESDLQIVKTEYIHLPKRSKVFWEISRLIFFPLWFVSRRLYIQFNGGFVLVMVKSKNGKK